MKSPWHFPYHFRLSMTARDMFYATSWCDENFGEHWNTIDNTSGTWCSFWRGHTDPTKYDWHFVNERDALLFTLRWA